VSLLLIVAALAAGAATGVKRTTMNVVTDVDEGLKALVRRRIAGRPAGGTALERLRGDPEGRQRTLAAKLEQAGAGGHDQLVEAAQRLMAILDAEGTSAGRYGMATRSARGVQNGDHSVQDNVFNASNA